MKRNGRTVQRDPRDRRILGFAVLAIGLAHFAFPQVFDPINRLGFPRDARAFTYINGGIECTLGVLMAGRKTQRQANTLSVCYVIYLAGNVVHAQAKRQAAAVRTTRRHDIGSDVSIG